MRRLPFTLGNRRINFFNPSAGLGNCLIPMGCVLHLAAELNYRPVFFWLSYPDIGRADFGDLFETANLPFELVEGFEAEMTQLALTGFPFPSPNLLKRMVFRLFRSLVPYQYGKRDLVQIRTREATRKFREKTTLSLDTGRGYAIFAYNYFRYGCDLSWLKPAPQLTPRIIELKKQFAPDTVGVHLRGTDHIKFPSVEKIITRMHAEVELNPDVKFFFASDGDERGEAIAALFEERLIRLPRNARRKTLEGQQDAVVDLFVLSATSRIIGTRSSSFSTLAALMGNKPLLKVGLRIPHGKG